MAGTNANAHKDSQRVHLKNFKFLNASFAFEIINLLASAIFF